MWSKNSCFKVFKLLKNGRKLLKKTWKFHQGWVGGTQKLFADHQGTCGIRWRVEDSWRKTRIWWMEVRLENVLRVGHRLKENWSRGRDSSQKAHCKRKDFIIQNWA